MTVSFKSSKEDSELIARIVERAEVIYAANGLACDRLGLTMDILAVHANGCPLDLQGFLNMGQYDFVHDIAGIVRHLDRSTGRLMDCFLPRCALPEGI